VKAPALVSLLLAAPVAATAQHSASQRVDRAFAQLNARHPDSAEALLRPVVDSTVRATPAERAAAWLLLGFVDFYDAANPDSAAAQDFRRALAFSPALRGEWLAQVDAGLGAIWRRERHRAICGTAALESRESRDRLAPGDNAPVVDQKPQVLSGPQLWYPEQLRQAGVTGRVLMAAIVDTAGRIEPGSIKILTSPHDGLTREARRYLEGAKIRPARIGGQPVRTCIEVPVDFKIRQ